ncbi:NAD(P)/FAD-dependent oxidoreductase [Chloroflexi bacterium TSY]|nr:NAD(P)/FAD-dependent oxidoreductase [Chloroflexi bacterium TSY]
MNTSESGKEFDVIIVGGRPAGASLATHLGKAGLRVLIIDRITFPTVHPVSTPFVLPHTMSLLDELEADETDYAFNTPKIDRIVLEFKDYFRTFFFHQMINERDYMYTVDRGRFDATLWRNLERYPSVIRRENFAMMDLIMDEKDRVVGIKGRYPKQAEERLKARLVVGADGRYSTVAKQVGARIIHERTDLDTTLYYAAWENVAPYDEHGGTLAQIHTSGDGFSYVFMPTADGHTNVVAQGQSSLYDPPPGDVQADYLHKLGAQPYVWRRLKNAQQVAKLSGMKRIGNLFRQPIGDGWVLVGDAYHQKDSLDAQGIYDALLQAKLLGEELVTWYKGEKNLAKALDAYSIKAWEAMKPMFDATMERVQREIYSIAPPIVAKSVLRWILAGDEYQHRFSALLVRQWDPTDFLTPSLMLRSLAKGISGDVKRLVMRQPNPVAMPALNSLPTVNSDRVQ